MQHQDVKQRYDTAVKEAAQGDYEHFRWGSSDLKKAQYEMTSDAIQKYTSGLSIDRYLELGPGPGTWTKLFFDNHPDAHYDLIEISEEMTTQLKARLEYFTHISARVRNEDFSQAEITKKYNFFFSSRALEYINDKGAVIEKISRSLDAGARGCIITKQPQYSRYRLVKRKVSSFHSGQIDHESLTHLLKEHGLLVEKVFPVTVNFPLWSSAFLSRLLYILASRISFNFFTRMVTESYGVVFRKV